jgi:diguanylate cyclase (GGDEF)-like protein
MGSWRLNMTIRKRILLYSALALGAFLAAVYFVSRFALLNGFSRLERNYASGNVRRIQNHLENEQTQLSTVARDYAQWDRTYQFMSRHNRSYVRTELTDDTFNIIHINLFLLLDPSGRPILSKEAGNWPIGKKNLSAIAAAYGSSPAHARNSSLNGLLEINGRLFLLAYEPILNSHGDGAPRGTLVMGRGLSESLLSALAHSMSLPLWLEPADNAPLANNRQTLWTDGTNSVSFESDSTMLAYIPMTDLSGARKRLLVARIPSDLLSEGQKVTRYLLFLLMLAGAVHSGVLMIVLEGSLLSRVESLNRKINQVTVSGDLSLRLDSHGKDELSALAGTVNAMLTAIQKAKFELLQAQESLRFHAEHDSLTGVLNRRAIRDVLRRELARCRRENQSLGVMLADVDHFKRINDRYGHGAGDAALLTVVQRISSTLRPYDLIGRYGGEEFLVIAPGCDLELTQKLAERIRDAVSDEGVELGNENVTLTVSVGITLGTADSDPEFLVAVADSAMYQAKRNGRNRVEISLELPAPETWEASFS